MIFAHHHIGRFERDFVLKILLIFVESIVLIYIFRIGYGAAGCAVGIVVVGCLGTIALHAIVVLVAVEDRSLNRIKGRIAEVHKVIPCGVG